MTQEFSKEFAHEVSTEEHSTNAPKIWRIGLAFILFMTVTGSGIMLYLKHQHDLLHIVDAKQKASNHKHTQALETPSRPLFYESIGNSPPLDLADEGASGTLEEGLALLQSPQTSENTSVEESLPPAFTIEAAFYTQKEEAEAHVESLKKLGFQAYYTPLLSHDYVIYRVRIGIFESEAAAQKALAGIQKNLKSQAKVTQLH